MFSYWIEYRFGKSWNILGCSNFYTFNWNILKLAKNFTKYHCNQNQIWGPYHHLTCNSLWQNCNIWLSAIVTNSSIFAVVRDLESASKIRSFKHFRFLFQPNEKLVFAKYNNRCGLRNAANAQYRAFFAIFNSLKLFTPSKRDPSKILKGVLDPLLLKYIQSSISDYRRKELLPQMAIELN